MRLFWCLAIACVLGASAMPAKLAWHEDPIAHFEQATGRLAVGRRDGIAIDVDAPWILVEPPLLATRDARPYTSSTRLAVPHLACESPTSLARGPPNARAVEHSPRTSL